jgi:predicted amidohydrolase YtcJ
MFEEDNRGRIANGYLADFVILNAPLFTSSPSWSDIKPLATYVGGNLVYEMK